MKWIIWTLAGLLAAFWTGATALLGLAFDRTGQALQQAGSAAPVPLPAELPGWLAGWVGAWVDPAVWTTMVDTARQALDAAQAMLPTLGTAAGWLEPLLWVVWGFGMVVLLAVAAGSHWLAGRHGGGAPA